MLITSVIFLVYYSKLQYCQRRNDKNRITNLKNVVELEDLDFMQMVSDLQLDYDDTDLKEIEKEVISQLRSKGYRIDLDGKPLA